MGACVRVRWALLEAGSVTTKYNKPISERKSGLSKGEGQPGVTVWRLQVSGAAENDLSSRKHSSGTAFFRLFILR